MDITYHFITSGMRYPYFNVVIFWDKGLGIESDYAFLFSSNLNAPLGEEGAENESKEWQEVLSHYQWARSGCQRRSISCSYSTHQSGTAQKATCVPVHD